MIHPFLPWAINSSITPSAVEAHFSHPKGREWKSIADTVTPLLAALIGQSVRDPPSPPVFYVALIAFKVLRKMRLHAWAHSRPIYTF